MHHRSPAAAVVGAVALVATALAGAPAIGAPGEAPAVPSTEVGFSFGPAGSGLIADDAVYWSFDFYRSTIYRSPLTHDGGATSFGEGELVGRTMVGSAYAEHAGTLAYVRAVDGQLVLRAADGTESLPDWGEHPGLRAGVIAITDHWVVGVSGFPDDGDQDHTLYNRTTGEAYDLDALIELPAGFTAYSEGALALSDDRVLWTDRSTTGQEQDWLDRAAVYTLALGPDVPVGPATALDAGTGRIGEPGSYVQAVGIDGTRLTWLRVSYGGPTVTQTVRWLDAAPYSGSPSELTVTGELLRMVDGAVVMHDPMSQRVSWLDLDAPGAPSYAADVRDQVVAVGNGTVMHQDWGDVVVYLTDATGAALTGDTGHYGAPSFNDVLDTDPFGDEILWLAQYGIIGGYEDGSYRNHASVSRAAMAAFLYRAAHRDDPVPVCTEAPFADVPVDHPFCGEIAWLAGTEVTTGWADGTFRPGAPISRGAMAAFLYRMAVDTSPAPACTTRRFTDVPVGGAFCGEIAWLAQSGVTTGWPDGSFRPVAPISREAMAAFLFRAIDRALL